MLDRINQLKAKKKELEEKRDYAVHEQNRCLDQVNEYNKRASDEAAANPYFRPDINFNVANAKMAYDRYKSYNETVIHAIEELEAIDKELESLKNESPKNSSYTWW